MFGVFLPAPTLISWWGWPRDSGVATGHMPPSDVPSLMDPCLGNSSPSFLKVRWLYPIPPFLPALLILAHTHGLARGSISLLDLAGGGSDSLKEPRHNSIQHIPEVLKLMIIHSQAFIIPFGIVVPSQFHLILPAPAAERAPCLLRAASFSAMLREFFFQRAFSMLWRTISPSPLCPYGYQVGYSPPPKFLQ